MRRLRYSVPYIAGKNLPKDSDPAPRGAGPFSRASARCGRHFNPPAPCGAGLPVGILLSISDSFQSTRPLRGGTRRPRKSAFSMLFQSTRPLRGGTVELNRRRKTKVISIHPPLAGRDACCGRCRLTAAYFNPPAPCGAGQRSCTKKLCKTSHIAQKVHLPWPY